MPAPKALIELVDLFDRNIESYKSGQYKETEVRLQFIDPFFELLGWDVHNRAGYSEDIKEVKHEYATKDRGKSRSPDYCFRTGKTPKFLVEAKKPSVNVHDDMAPSYQIRSYAWNLKLPIGILTDFEEFVVYDCRFKPRLSDKSSTARLQYLTYKQYVDEWDALYALFSKNAILKGSFDTFADKKTRKGTQEVDDSLLHDIDIWRESLAKDIKKNNQSITEAELNFAVQMIIDRILFLRVCEDRGIEAENRLKQAVEKNGSYRHVVDLFRQADTRYNSGLFHLAEERGRKGNIDQITPNLTIDDATLQKIVTDLYYPTSPYQFDKIPIEVLGAVYEQFLGKVIRVTDKRVTITEKPEVRKAGGVYYTPKYIVDYIVENTVGKLLERNTPEKVTKLRILDPACGSGSFLIGAYQYLLDWHLEWYSQHEPETWVKKKTPVIYRDTSGSWKLTTAEKKRILLKNIYGVDIDSQAVEVTKLSLLLKVLEGETSETLGQVKLFHTDRALPDLSSNIKCGNSLIGSDYNKGKLQGLNDQEEATRVNAFDWDAEFVEIMNPSTGGFDAVIGNPPYIRVQTMTEWAPLEVQLYKQYYKAASKGNYDIYVCFVEQGLSLLNPRGRLGYILPHKFFNAQYGESLRGLIASGKHLAEVVHFGDQQVFDNATTYTCLMFLDKAGSKECSFTKVVDLQKWQLEGKAETGQIPASKIRAADWNFQVGSGSGLFDKLSEMPVKLGNVAERIFQGLVTGADPVFILTKNGAGEYESEATGLKHKLEKNLLHLLCKGSVNLKRYHIQDPEKVILFPYRLLNNKATLIEFDQLQKDYPMTAEYLSANRKTLEERERGKWKHSKWYAFGRSQNLAEMEQKKILTPSIASGASFTYDLNSFFYFVGSGAGGGGGYGITLRDDKSLSYHYVLGLLNSSLLDYYLKSISSRFRGGYYAYNRQYIEQLPIHVINFADNKEKARYNCINQLVDTMLQLYSSLVAVQTTHEREMIQRQIDATNREIDQLVYKLYGLTEKEIRVVEEYKEIIT